MCPDYSTSAHRISVRASSYASSASGNDRGEPLFTWLVVQMPATRAASQPPLTADKTSSERISPPSPRASFLCPVRSHSDAPPHTLLTTQLSSGKNTTPKRIVRQAISYPPHHLLPVASNVSQSKCRVPSAAAYGQEHSVSISYPLALRSQPYDLGGTPDGREATYARDRDIISSSSKMPP